MGQLSDMTMDKVTGCPIAVMLLSVLLMAIFVKGRVFWSEKIVKFVPMLGKGSDSKIKTLNDNYKVDQTTSLQFDSSRNANNFYDLATEFYEYGWGQSFHFSTRYKGESFRESILRHEYMIALACGLKRDDHVIDLGCGIGGPARDICRFVGCRFTCVTINPAQIARGTTLTSKNLPIKFVEADFTNLEAMEAESFDKAMNIEAIVHAKDHTNVFKEVLRVLKPGGLLFNYEWVLNDKYDPKDLKHVEIKRGIEHGNGLPDLLSYQELEKAAIDAGFEVMESYDLAVEAEKRYGGDNIPWYRELMADFSLSGFRKTKIGMAVTGWMLAAFEAVGLVPAGSTKTATMLENGAHYIVQGALEGFFSPMHVLLLRKPLKSM